MHVYFFFQIAAAVVIGNALTAAFVFFCWQVKKHGENPGLSVCLCGAVPPLTVAAVAYSLGT